MDTTQLLQNLLLGGLLGMLGQGVRMLAGLKKLAESADATTQENIPFDTRRLLVSLFLGFIAGALGIVTLLDDKEPLVITKDVILTLIGMGYAGVDFIESLLTKYTSKETASKPKVTGESLESVQQSTTFIQVPRLPYSSK